MMRISLINVNFCLYIVKTRLLNKFQMYFMEVPIFYDHVKLSYIAYSRSQKWRISLINVNWRLYIVKTHLSNNFQMHPITSKQQTNTYNCGLPNGRIKASNMSATMKIAYFTKNASLNNC